MNKIKKKIVLIGPLPPPITGCSMVNKLIFEELSLNKFYKIDKINRSFPDFNEAAGVFSIKKVLTYIGQYARFYKIFTADLVHIAIGLTFLGVLKDAPFILLAKVLRKEVIIHIHGNFLKTQYDMLNGFKKKLFHFILSKADKGIVSSKLLSHNLTPFLKKEKIFWIHYFVEKSLEHIKEEDVINTNNGLQILFLSNLMESKGIFDVFDALEILNKRKIPYKARIIGAFDKKYENRIHTFLKSNTNVEYSTPIRGEKKVKAYLDSNVFILPTYYKIEGQPISLLEAMMVGNIIITTDHAGILDICSEKNGFIVNKKAPEEIADKLQYIAENLDDLSNLMVHNHNYAKEHFKPSNFINNLIEVFEA